MTDPWGSIQNFIGQFQGFMKNPAQAVQQRLGIPQGMTDPDKMIQHMMSTGQLTQEQYNAARSAAGRIQNNPMFRQMFKR